MKIQYECIPCALNSYLRLVGTGIVPDYKQEEILRKLLDLYSTVSYDYSPPVLGSKLHRLIRESLHNSDPYHGVKQKYNEMMMGLYSRFEEMIEESPDPMNMAMRLAVAGNVIDFGAKMQLDIMDTIRKVLDAKFAVDDSKLLFSDLKAARRLLYIGDNCGEIVLDKLFLSRIQVQEKVFVVRESPVINDITRDDAEMVGIDKIASIASTGDDSPGAVWETASEEFKYLFRNSDIIISKGQGNLEGLLDIPHKNIYFLLTTKCDLVAGRVGAKKGEFIVKKGDKE